jgi:hypothetical protein
MPVKYYYINYFKKEILPRERNKAQRKILLRYLRVYKANGVKSRISLSNDDIKKINSIKDLIVLIENECKS